MEQPVGAGGTAACGTAACGTAEGMDEAVASPTTFFALLQQLHATGYTGLVVLHVSQGVPKKAEFPLKIQTGRQIVLREADRA